MKDFGVETGRNGVLKKISLSQQGEILSICCRERGRRVSFSVKAKDMIGPFLQAADELSEIKVPRAWSREIAISRAAWVSRHATIPLRLIALGQLRRSLELLRGLVRSES
jgi:hypothetical protein